MRPDELDKATMAGCRDEAAWTFLEWRGKRIYLEYLSTSHFFRRASVDAQLGPLPPTVGPVRPSVALLPVRALRPLVSAVDWGCHHFAFIDRRVAVAPLLPSQFLRFFVSSSC
jgi:hypothetical protein